MKEKTAEKSKKKYEKPKLKALGDFAKITRGTTKGSNKNDGTGKPATKASGSTG